MSLNFRIKEIRKEFCNNSTKLFAQKLGISSQAISNYIRDGYNIGREVIENILNVFPNIDANWLITGKGEMLKRDTDGGINLNNVGSGIIGNAGTMTMGNVQHYPNNVDGNNLVVDDGIKDDKDQQIIFLKEKVLHLEEMLKEKERFIQVLLKNQ